MVKDLRISIGKLIYGDFDQRKSERILKRNMVNLDILLSVIQAFLQTTLQKVILIHSRIH